MVLSDEEAKKIAEEILQFTPPTVVSCTTLFGLPLSEWVYLVTILYTIVGILTVIKRHWIDPYLRAKRRLRMIEERLKNEANLKLEERLKNEYKEKQSKDI